MGEQAAGAFDSLVSTLDIGGVDAGFNEATNKIGGFGTGATGRGGLKKLGEIAKTPGQTGILGKDPFGKDPAGIDESIAQRQQAFEDAKELETSFTRDSTLTDATETDLTTTSGLQFDPQGKTEQELLQESINNFNRSQTLLGQQEAGIADRGALQSSARGGLEGIMSGDAFATTDTERQRVDALRLSELGIGRNQMDSFLNERLGQLNAQAAQRGVRGQAFSQLQGDAVGEAADQFNRQILESNRLAAQREVEFAGQRVGAQQQVGSQFASFQDDATQQAFANRTAAQDIQALNQIRDERLKAGKNVTTETGGTTRTQTQSQTGTDKGAAAADILQNISNAPTAKQQTLGTVMGTSGQGAEIAGNVKEIFGKGGGGASLTQATPSRRGAGRPETRSRTRGGR